MTQLFFEDHVVLTETFADEQRGWDFWFEEKDADGLFPRPAWSWTGHVRLQEEVHVNVSDQKFCDLSFRVDFESRSLNIQQAVSNIKNMENTILRSD